MSILRSHGKVEGFECDECGDTFVADQAGEFSDILDQAKADGWQSWQNKGLWEHFCATCVKATGG